MREGAHYADQCPQLVRRARGPDVVAGHRLATLSILQQPDGEQRRPVGGVDDQRRQQKARKNVIKIQNRFAELTSPAPGRIEIEHPNRSTVPGMVEKLQSREFPGASPRRVGFEKVLEAAKEPEPEDVKEPEVPKTLPAPTLDSAEERRARTGPRGSRLCRTACPCAGISCHAGMLEQKREETMYVQEFDRDCGAVITREVCGASLGPGHLRMHEWADKSGHAREPKDDTHKGKKTIRTRWIIRNNS